MRLESRALSFVLLSLSEGAGQPHLPNPRGPLISSLDRCRKPSNQKSELNFRSARGWEGGLAPAHAPGYVQFPESAIAERHKRLCQLFGPEAVAELAGMKAIGAK